MAILNNTQNIKSLLINGAELSGILSSLNARQDSLTTALSSAAGDYNTEILDARADAFGSSHENTGNNIRHNQKYLFDLIIEKFNTLQEQYNALSNAYISLARTISNMTGDEIL